LTVTPRAGASHSTAGDRVAAAAPYLVGLASVVSGYAFGSALWILFGLGMFQVPSRADVDAMRGEVTWRGLVG